MIGPRAIHELEMNEYTQPFRQAAGGKPGWSWTAYETEILAAKSPLLRELIAQAGSTDKFIAATLGGGLNPRLWPFEKPDPVEAPKPPEPATPGPGQPTSPGMLHGGTVGKETEMILAAIAELKALIVAQKG